MNDETIERVSLYARDYIVRFNEVAPTLAELGPPVSLLPVPISVALVFPASDGALIFYLSADAAALMPEVGRQPGVHFLEFGPDPQPLAHLLPALTFNHIKVAVPPSEALRADLSNLPDPRLLPDVPRDQLIWIGISPEMHAAVGRGHRVVTAMAVTPIRQFRDGKVVGESPTRVRVVSPVIDVGSGQLVRQYLWSFADVLWHPEQLNLDSERARLFAQFDVDALRLGVESGLPQPQLFQDPFEAVASHVEEIASRFETLLDTPDVGSCPTRC